MGGSQEAIHHLLQRFGYQREAELAELSGQELSTVRSHLTNLKAAGRAQPLDDDGLWGAV